MAGLGTVSSLVGTVAFNVISALLAVGQIGIYQVMLELISSVTADPQSQLTILQGLNTSNIVTIPIGDTPQQ